ncbi:uncharacterized protein JCM6883_005331 [Sporobolomyces salmoneus]|uniref:uncharacterized protein n=1 Tax=Sporobolomyces salmoneus TaxID=183962 RepID=UPI0031780384
MLLVTLLPSRGNPNAPEFPFDGLFGLTDVTLRGKLSVKYDQRHPHPKPVELCSAVVRLVRIDILNRATTREVVREEVVWLPGKGSSSAKMGEWEKEFELVVPPSTRGLSRMGMMLGKVPGHSAVTSWKLEATLTFPRDRPTSAPPREVSLLRHSLPALSSPSLPPLAWTSSPSPIPLDYDIRIPNRPLGWNDSSEISVHFRAPASSTFCLKSLELILSREVTILYGSTSSTVIDDIPLDFFRLDDSPKLAISPFHTPSSTPTEEHDRLLWRRSPSPPDRASTSSPSTSVARSSWPLMLSEGENGFVEARAQLKFRPRPSSNHRWSLGETGENKFIRINYTIRPRISYKRSGGSFAPERHLDLDRLPIHLAAVNVPERLNSSFLRLPSTFSSARSMGARRHSDFNLRLNLSPDPSPSTVEIPAPERQPSPETAMLEDRPFRPSTGRRRSEQSESFGQPARTRARVEEPKVRRRPATATGVVPAFSVPDPSTMPTSTKALSPSSTYDSLGPETPTTLEFLLTPVPTLNCDAPNPHVRSGSFPLANPVHRNHTSSSSPRPPSTRSTRSLRQAYRPRSSGTLSIASTTSTASSVADSNRFVREMSAPSASTSSSTILESSHELLGLSLSDATRSVHSPHLQPSGLTIPVSASSSPSSSPDLSLDQTGFFPTTHFDAYSISPVVTSLPYGRNNDRATIAPWHSPPSPEYERRSRATSPLVNSAYRSAPSPPRLAREPSSASTFCASSSEPRIRGISPPSPPVSVVDSPSSLLVPSSYINARSRSSLSPESAAYSNQKRKGSVGGLLSLLTRRGSKV